MDRLADIFDRQEKLGERLKTKDFITFDQLCLALTHEVMELHDTCHWKWWKKHHNSADVFKMQEAAKEELVDVLHFVVAIAIRLGMDAGMIHRLYIEKNKINHKRQDDGY